jgi:hypothetical protein
LRKPISWLNIFPAQRKVFGKAQNAREQLTVRIQRKREPISLPRGVATLSLSLSLSERFVFLGRLFLRARWRANFFLSFFSPPANKVSLLRANARFCQQQRIHKKESLEVKSRERVL